MLDLLNKMKNKERAVNTFVQIRITTILFNTIMIRINTNSMKIIEGHNLVYVYYQGTY